MRVLIAVGRNAACSDPVAAVLSLPWTTDTVFSVLTVSELAPPPPALEIGYGATDLADIKKRTETAAGETATMAAARLSDRGFHADAITKQGEPTTIIIEHAKEWDADLIVVGSCEKSRIEKFILGSVSEGVVKRAPCSVLVVKPETSR